MLYYIFSFPYDIKKIPEGVRWFLEKTTLLLNCHLKLFASVAEFHPLLHDDFEKTFNPSPA